MIVTGLLVISNQDEDKDRVATHEFPVVYQIGKSVSPLSVLDDISPGRSCQDVMIKSSIRYSFVTVLHI